MVISLGWLSPATSCGLPAAQTTRAGSRCLFGLAPTGGCRATPVAGRAVGSYPTVSPLPFGIQGRSVLCGPVPSPRGAQALPGGLPCGARTFLEWPLQPATRDHRPHHFQGRKLPAHRAKGQALLREASDHATQTIGRRAIEPKPRMLAKRGESQPRPFARCERGAVRLQSGGRERVYAALAIASHQGTPPAPPALFEPKQDRGGWTGEAAQQTEG